MKKCKRNALRPAILCLRTKLLFVFLLVFTACAFSQSVGDFRSNGTGGGNWNAAGTWQTFNGTSYVAAASAPSNTSNAVVILGNDNVTITANETISKLTVNAAGTLKLNSGFTLTMAGNLTANGSITINGSLLCSTYIVSGSGSFTLASAATISIGAAGGISASGATGNIQTTTRSFSAAAIYTYASAAAQVTGSGLPASLTTTLTNNNTSTASGLTLSQSLVINNPGSFSVTTGSVLSCLTYTISGTGTFTLANGATLFIGDADGINLAGTSLGNIQTTTRNFGTGANYTYQSTSAQQTGTGLPSGCTGTITDNNTSSAGLKFTANFSVAGTGSFVVPTGAVLDCSFSNVSGSGSFILNSGATIIMANTAGITASGNSGNIQTQTRSFSSNANYSYNSTAIQVTGSGLPSLLTGTLTINSTVTLTQDMVVNTPGSVQVQTKNFGLSTYVISGTGSFSVNAGATLSTGNANGISSSGATGSIQTTARTFDAAAIYNYNGSSAQVTGSGLPSPVAQLQVSTTNGAVVSLSNNVTLTNMLTLTSGQLSLAGKTLTPSLSGITRKDGTLSIGTGTLAFPASMNVTYTSTADVVTGPEMPTSATSLASLTVNTSTSPSLVTVTLGTDITVNGTIYLYTGQLCVGAFKLNLPNQKSINRRDGVLCGNITYPVANSVVDITYTSTTADIVTGNEMPSSSTALRTLTINTPGHTVTLAANTTVNTRLTMTAGNIVLNGFTLNYAAAATLLYNGTAAQTTGVEWPSPFSKSISILNTYNTTGVALNAAHTGYSGAITVGNTGFFNTNGYALSGTGSIVVSGSSTGSSPGVYITPNANGVSASGDIQLSGTRDFRTGSGYVFNGSTAQVTGAEMPASISSLTINNAAGVTQGIVGGSSNTLTITGGLTLTSGIYNVAANNMNLLFHTGNLPVSRTAGTITVGSQTSLQFGGTGNNAGNAFSLPNGVFTASAPSFASLVINRTNSISLGNQDINPASLTLTAGILGTGSNKVISSAVSRVAGHVNGTLQLPFTTGSNIAQTFTIGDATNYTPVTVTVSTVTTAGAIAAKSTAGDHPLIASSSINATKSVNRYYTLTNAGTGLNNYSAVFNFITTDPDAAANTGNLAPALYNAGWTNQVAGARTSTSTQATGITGFGDFALGENCNVSTGFTYAASPYCTNAGNPAVTLNSGSTAGTFTSFPAGLSLDVTTGTINMSLSTPGTYTVNNTATGIAGCISASSAPVTITTALNASISYAAASYCGNAGTIPAVLTGTTGGSFSSSPATLSINAASGALDINNSPAGSYVVSYTIPANAGCGDYIVTANVEKLAQVTPSVSIALTGGANPSCSGSPVVFTATPVNGGAAAYQWKKNGINTGTNSATYTDAGTIAGSITCVMTSGLSCVTAATATSNAISLGITAKLTPAVSVAISSGSNPTCAGAAVSFTATATNGGTVVYQWKKDGTNVGANNAVYTDAGLLPGNITCEITSSLACVSSATATSNTVLLAVNANTWLAGTDGNWNKPSNWCAGVVPTAATDVFIPAATTPYPVLTTATVVRALQIEQGASITIGANTLTINGALGGGGTITGSAVSSLVLAGSSAQLLNFTTGNEKLNNLTLSHSAAATVTLNTKAEIYGAISWSSNVSTLDLAGKPVTLKSSATATATIGNIRGYLTGATRVTVERYIPQNPNRAWRLLSVPTSGQTIHEAWQENQPADTDPATGYGTILTSNSPNWQANGYDEKTPGNSLLTYDPTGDALVPVPGTAASIATRAGYFVYIRGDRSVKQSASINSVNTANLRTTGTIYQGTQPAISVAAGKSALVGNVYPAALDLRSIITSGGLATTSFQVWDPKLAGSYGLGAYQTFTPDNGNYVVTPGGGSYGASGSVNNVIQPGQAFFVQAFDSDGTITLTEAAKTTGTTSTVFSIPAAGGKLITNLYAVTDTSVNLADGTLQLFDNASDNRVDAMDAIKRYNFGENIYIEKNNYHLVVEKRRPPVANDTIFYRLEGLKRKAYELQFAASAPGDNQLAAWLEDSYTNIATPVNLQGKTTVRFSVDANAASVSVNRFRLVFKQDMVLPVTFETIKAYPLNNQVAVDWQVSNQQNISHYIIEKSTDGRVFTKAGFTAVKNESSSTVSYQWIDSTAGSGDLYYRVISAGKTGADHYSRIVKLHIAPGAGSVTVFPNPVKGNSISLRISNVVAGRYAARLLRADGSQVLAQTFMPPGNGLQTLNLTNTIANGAYMLEVLSPDGVSTMHPFIIAR